MKSAIDHLLIAIDDRFAQFEVKLWSLIKDEFDLYVQVDELRIAQLMASRKSHRRHNEAVGVKQYLRGRLNGKPEKLVENTDTFASGTPTFSMASTFTGLQNRLQKCEMHLWSLLDEKLELQSIIDEVRQENERTEEEEAEDGDTNEKPSSNIDSVLPPIETIYVNKSPRKTGKKTFTCDICGRRYNRKNTMRMHMEQQHTSRELLIN